MKVFGVGEHVGGVRSGFHRSWVLLGGLLLLLAGAWTPAALAGPPAGLDVVAVSYSFDVPTIGPDPVDSDYDRIEIDGLAAFALDGEPTLPVKTARILIPFGADVDEVTITPRGKTILEGPYRLRPGERSYPLSWTGPVEPTEPDPVVYGSFNPFPAECHGGRTLQRIRGAAVLVVNLFPVGYVPATGTLFHFESIDVRVTLTEADAASDGFLLFRGLDQDLGRIAGKVDKPAIASSYPALEGTGLAPRSDYDYVIITSEALRDAAVAYTFQDLLDLKAAHGLSGTIVTTEWIYANYPGERPDGGTDDQTRIRNFIIDAYRNWGTEYVLLGGDGDRDAEDDRIVPARGLYGSYSGTVDSNMPGDVYYACLDGTWDKDADGRYGEKFDGEDWGYVDVLAEVVVGRACVDSADELSEFVRKTIAYETAGADPYTAEAWMVGEYIGFGGVSDYAANSLDEIVDGTCNHGYCTAGLESAPFLNVNTLYEKEASWDGDDIIDVINSEVHLINHLGHANTNYVMQFYNDDVDRFTNDKSFIGYSQGCYCGAFDSDDCIVEVMNNGPHGAVAFLANSRYGWGAGSSTDGPSQHFHREFWDAVLAEGIYEIGAANQDSKEDNIGFFNESLIRWCYYEVNLFGDPALTIRTVQSAGSVETDRAVYPVPATMEIRLYDRDVDLDPNAPDTVAVACASATEPAGETVTLVETGPSTQVFLGMIDLAAGAPGADGLLQVSDGDEVTVTYDDADAGEGAPAVVEAVALADASEPVVDDVAAAIADTYATILWTTNEAATSVVRYGDTTPPAMVASEHALAGDHAVTIGGLDETTRYYYAVESMDSAGNTTLDDNEGAYYTFVTRTFAAAFIDDFESGAGDWEHWGAGDEWELGGPIFRDGPDDAYSGEDCWGTDLSHKYGDFCDAKLVSGVYPTGSGSRLSFQQWHHIESGYDYGTVEVSTDGGATWSEVGRYSGTSAGWTEETIDLWPFAGDLRFRFRMRSDTGTAYAGWYIDDVKLGRLVPEGIVYQTHTLINEGDRFIQPGESAEMTMTLLNASESPAPGVSATLAADDACVTITDDTAFFGDIGPGLQAAGADTFALTVDEACEEGHVALLDLQIASTNGESWSDTFGITVHHVDCWDADGDGFDDEFCGGDDCDDTLASVNPDAEEDTSNDMDDDCDGRVDEGGGICFVGAAR